MNRVKLQPARYAIVGSRGFPYRDLVSRFVARLPEGSTVISGGARGVDSWATDAAKAHGLTVEVFPAQWTRADGSLDRGAGMARNSLIVDAAEILVAFHWRNSRGTADSIAKARAAGKPCWVCTGLGQWSL